MKNFQQKKTIHFFPLNECLPSSVVVSTPFSGYQERCQRKPLDEQDSWAQDEQHSSWHPSIGIHWGVQGTCGQEKKWWCLFPSSAQVFVPCISAFQRREREKLWVSSSTILGIKKHEHLLLLEAKISLGRAESRNICSHSEQHLTFWGTPRKTQFLHSNDPSCNRKDTHLLQGFSMIR